MSRGENKDAEFLRIDCQANIRIFKVFIYLSLFLSSSSWSSKNKTKIQNQDRIQTEAAHSQIYKKENTEKKEDRLQMVWFVDAVPMEKWSGWYIVNKIKTKIG